MYDLDGMHAASVRSKRSTWAALAGLAVPLGVLAFAACQTPTSMQIVVSTDVDCASLPGEHLAHVVAGRPEDVVEVTSPSTTKPCEASGHVGDVVLLPADDETAAVALKVILGVDRSTEVCGTVTPDSVGITDEEKAWSGCIVARRRLGFVEGAALVVDVPLHVSCIGVPCSEAAFTTCIEGGRCVPADIDPDDCLGGGCGEDELPGSVGSGPIATAATTGSSGDGGAATTSSQGGGNAATGGGDGGAGGGGSGCFDPIADCPAAGPCIRQECIDGSCQQVFEPDGAPCVGGLCDGGACAPFAHCGNAMFDPGDGETATDCGGECPPCDEGEACSVEGDCVTLFCDRGECAPCAGEVDCPSETYYCAAGGRCEEDQSNGSPCDVSGAGDDCASGECVPDGVGGGICCNESCTGTCEGCGTGTCQPLALGATPNGCEVSSCANGCDGAGSCRFRSASTICGATCEAGVGTTVRCNGAGSCSDAAVASCGLYACENDACLNECQGNTDCTAGATCNASNDCTGDACSVDGECNPPAHPSCLRADCNNSGTCGFAPANEGASCAAECSTEGDAVVTGTCGNGSCNKVETVQCCPFVCRGAACLATCDSDDDCVPGTTCNMLTGECGSGGPGPNFLIFPGLCGVVQ